MHFLRAFWQIAFRPRNAIGGRQTLPANAEKTEGVMSSQDQANYRQELAEIEREFSDEERAWNNGARTRLIMWLVRWCIVFAVIGVIYFYRPGWTWLWWMGIAAASASLTLTLTTSAVMRRRFQRGRQRLAAADAFADCLDRVVPKTETPGLKDG